MEGKFPRGLRETGWYQIAVTKKSTLRAPENSEDLRQAKKEKNQRKNTTRCEITGEGRIVAGARTNQNQSFLELLRRRAGEKRNPKEQRHSRGMAPEKKKISGDIIIVISFP